MVRGFARRPQTDLAIVLLQTVDAVKLFPRDHILQYRKERVSAESAVTALARRAVAMPGRNPVCSSTSSVVWTSCRSWDQHGAAERGGFKNGNDCGQTGQSIQARCAPSVSRSCVAGSLRPSLGVLE